MYVDPSGKGKDETAYAVVKSLNGRLFLTAAGGFMGGYDTKVLRGLLAVARRQDVTDIVIEPNFGGGMFAQLLRAEANNFHPCSIEDGEWAKGQKETRIIDVLEPVMNQHRLVVCRSVIEADHKSTENYPDREVNRRRLFFQMTRLTRDKGSLAHDDRIEALAGAVSFWVDRMSQSAEQAVIAHKENLLDKELAKFMDHALGRAASGRNEAWSSRIMAKRTWH
jgi:hypothetical protein